MSKSPNKKQQPKKLIYMQDDYSCRTNQEMRRVKIETKSTINRSKLDELNSNASKRSRYTCVSKPVHSSSSDCLDRNIGEKCSNKKDLFPSEDLIRSDKRSYDLNRAQKNKEAIRLIKPENLRERLIGKAKSHIGVFPGQKTEDKCAGANKVLQSRKITDIPPSVERILNKENKTPVSEVPQKVHESCIREDIIKGSSPKNKIVNASKAGDGNKIFKEIFHNKDVFNSEEMLDKENLTENPSKIQSISNQGRVIISPNQSSKSGSGSLNLSAIESDMDTTKCLYASQSDSKIDISGQVSLHQLNSSKNFGVSSSNFQSSHRDIGLSANRSSIKYLDFKFKPLQEKYEYLRKSPIMRLPQIDTVVKGNSLIQEDDYQCWLRKHKFLEQVDSVKKMNYRKEESMSSIKPRKEALSPSECSDLTSVSQKNEVIRIQFKSSFEESLLIEQNVLWNGVKYLYDIYSNEEIIVERVSITDKFTRFVIAATFIYFVIYFDNFLSDFDMQIF